MIGFIASLSTELTLWLGAGMTLGAWYLVPGGLLITAVIADAAGYGSMSDFFTR